jgi:hypothetical protein
MISFKCKLFEFLFGDGVWGDAVGKRCPQTRHEQNTSPKDAGSGEPFGDVAGDALIVFSAQAYLNCLRIELGMLSLAFTTRQIFGFTQFQSFIQFRSVLEN